MKDEAEISNEKFIHKFEDGRNTDEPLDIKVYKARWLMLFIYVLYSAANAMQWLEYCIIINIVKRYYNVGDYEVDWTSMVTMITYAPFVLPSTYITYRLVSNCNYLDIERIINYLEKVITLYHI